MCVCRSTGVISRLNKSCVESIDSLTDSSPMLSTGTDGAASTALTEEGESGLNSQSVVTLGSLTSAKPGEDLNGYLGLFSQQGKGESPAILTMQLMACAKAEVVHTVVT